MKHSRSTVKQDVSAWCRYAAEFLFVMSALTFSAYSTEVSIYALADGLLGEPRDAASMSAGGGVGVQFNVLPLLGMSARVEAEGIIPTRDEIDGWFALSASCGVWRDVSLSSVLSLRPELNAGIYMHHVTASEINTDGWYFDPLICAGTAVRFSPLSLAKYGITVECAPLVTLLLEKDAAVWFVGARLGTSIKL